MTAAFVLQGIGSLSEGRIRFANRPDTAVLQGSLEILTLAGSLAPDGAHLHISVADAQGCVLGGHVGYGCIVRTTAEILIAFLPDYRFSRVPDAESGYAELAIQAVRPQDGS
jgi:predicted DNA-binding protein with PD1-like motif